MSQKGFTLIEILVVMAVGSVLMTGLVMSIYNIVWGSARSNNQVVALTDVNHAAWWLKKDLMMTQNTNLTDGVPQSSVTLSWTDYTGFEPEDERNHSSAYALLGTELRRTYDGTVSIAGRNITSIVFTQDGRLVDVVITATAPGAPQQPETLKLSAYMRAVGVQ